MAEETVDLGKDLGLALQRQQLLGELDGGEDGLGHFLKVGGGNLFCVTIVKEVLFEQHAGHLS